MVVGVRHEGCTFPRRYGDEVSKSAAIGYWIYPSRSRSRGADPSDEINKETRLSCLQDSSTANIVSHLQSWTR